MRHRPLIPPASATAIGLALASLSALTFAGEARAGAASHRLIVLADMGNEPDEMQQMVHMLVYANEFDLEGLVAVTGKYLRKKPRPKKHRHRYLSDIIYGIRTNTPYSVFYFHISSV